MPAPCKCVIWDLDDTLWDGICLEGQVTPRPETVETIETLRDRGIIHAVASRGDETVATETLRRFGLDGLFITARINWLPKSTNIAGIARAVNLPLDALAFVDDDAFERAQVEFMLPDVRVYPADRASELPRESGFEAGATTAEGAARSRLYQEEQARSAAADAFATREDFLHDCRMRLSLRPAEARDIPRVAELMRRTHQMNSTGLLLTGDELDGIIRGTGEGRTLYVAELTDRFGWCGIISTTLLVARGAETEMQLFAMSCRVMGRGVERAILSFFADRADDASGMTLCARYRPTERNRMMRTMFQMSGFRARPADDDAELLFDLDPRQRPTCPSWVSYQ